MTETEMIINLQDQVVHLTPTIETVEAMKEVRRLLAEALKLARRTGDAGDVQLRLFLEEAMMILTRRGGEDEEVRTR